MQKGNTSQDFGLVVALGVWFVAKAWINAKSCHLGRRIQEFNYRHRYTSQNKPTVLVSVSDKLSRTISGALRERNVKEEREEDIWIALIFVPSSKEPAPYHSAADLVSLEEKITFNPNISSIGKSATITSSTLCLFVLF